MKVIIAGSRGIEDYELVKSAVEESGFSEQITAVLSGRARGVDRLGEQWALEQGLEVLPFPAQWKRYGRRAGVLRNKFMVENADALIAIWDGKSRGTKNTIEEAKAKGLRVYVKKICDHVLYIFS